MGKARKKNKDKFDIPFLSHVTQELRDKAEAVAKKHGWSLSQLGREALEKFCK